MPGIVDSGQQGTEKHSDRSGLFCDYVLASSSQHAVSSSGVDGENISQSSKSRHPHQSSGDAGRWKERGGPGCPGCRRMPLSPDGSDSAL